jgi:general stress protein 26
MKTTTSERDPQAVTKLHHLVDEISVAMVTTVTPDGTLRSRPMFTRGMEEDGLLWFFLSDDSGMAHDLANEGGVNVTYSDPRRDRYVSVTGSASVEHDGAKLKQMWDAKLARYFPNGLDDPHLALLCVRIEFAEYWDHTTSRMAPVDGHAKAPGKHETGDHTKVDIRAARASG